jgi:hypothetical protein
VLLDQCGVTDLRIHGKFVLTVELYAKDKVHHCLAGDDSVLVSVVWVLDCYYCVYEYIRAAESSV